MNIAETIKTPRHHDANRPFGTAHMIKQPSKRTDVSGLQICKDPLPTHWASCGNKYARIFEKLKHGEAVEIEEKLKWDLIAAQARIEVWRTEQANNRNQDRTMR